MAKNAYPYSSCIANLISIDSYSSECYKKSFSPNRTYHFVDCKKTCVQKYIGDNCGCQISYLDFEFYEGMRKCYVGNLSLIENDLYCQKEKYNEFSNNEALLKACDCPLECEESGYTYFASMNDFPTQSFVSSLSQMQTIKNIYPSDSDRNYQNFKQSLSMVSIYYGQLQETIIEQSPKMQITDLVSTIGGILGLFLGMSFLSIVEFIEILVQTLIILLRNDNKLFIQNQQ